MIRILLRTYCLVLLAVEPGCRFSPEDAHHPYTEPPSEAIFVDGPELARLGRLSTRSLAIHARTVSNHTLSPLRLRVLRVSCPCVTVQIEPEMIAPGESASVTLLAPVLASGLEQSHDVEIEVISEGEVEARASSKFRVAVLYSADIDFVVKPEAMWIVAVEGLSCERRIFVRSPAIDALHIANIRSTLPDLAVVQQRKFIVPVEVPPPAEEAMSIRFRATFDTPGFYEGRIEFDTSHPDFKPAWIPVQVRVLPRWTSDPDGFAIILARDDNAPLDRSVRVATRDGSPLPKLSAKIENVDGEPGALGAFSVVVEPDAKADGVIVRLHTDVPKLVGTEGLARVVLTSEDGKFTRNISIAWIRRR